MEHREALRFGNDVFDRRQRTARERDIADVSEFCPQDPQRYLVSVRIEVPGNDYERVRISIEQSFRKQSGLERLSGALDGSEEETLGPTAYRAPREWTKLLSRHRRSKRHAQVQVDEWSNVAPTAISA